jgi:hypothetical protein
LLEFRFCVVEELRYTSGLAAAILNFWLPVRSNIVLYSSVEKLDTKNVGVAVEISTLASMVAEIHWFLYRICIKYYNFRFAAAMLD